jgi:hypothetical protein
MAAAMVHDVGHGMFSHAFEGVKDKLGLHDTKHKKMSQRLILETEIADLLPRQGKSFAQEAAELVATKPRRDFYDGIVASQFDADRPDSMRRDRIMTGIGSGAVDVRQRAWMAAGPATIAILTADILLFDFVWLHWSVNLRPLCEI